MCAAKVGEEEVIGIRYALRSLPCVRLSCNDLTIFLNLDVRVRLAQIYKAESRHHTGKWLLCRNLHMPSIGHLLSRDSLSCASHPKRGTKHASR
jgi:hypothetical protein